MARAKRHSIPGIITFWLFSLFISSPSQGADEIIRAQDKIEIQSKTVNYGAFQLTYSYDYYKNRLKKSLTMLGGTKYNYTYDPNNQVLTIDLPGQGGKTDNQYTLNSPVVITLAEATGTRNYIPNSGLLDLPTSNSELVTYSYDTNGNTIQITDSSGTTTFTNDLENRLQEELISPVENNCLINAPNLLRNSNECDQYGDQTYMGTNLCCFCKCAGDCPWSKNVRGCLRCMEESKVPTGRAHSLCYKNASDAGLDRPEFTLGFCYIKCLFIDCSCQKDN